MSIYEHQEQIKTTFSQKEGRKARKEGRKEGKANSRNDFRLLRARRFSFARRIFSGSNWIPPRWAGIFFFKKQLGQCKIGPFHVSRWWQLKHFFMFIAKFGEENHPFWSVQFVSNGLGQPTTNKNVSSPDLK